MRSPAAVPTMARNVSLKASDQLTCEHVYTIVLGLPARSVTLMQGMPNKDHSAHEVKRGNPPALIEDAKVRHLQPCLAANTRGQDRQSVAPPVHNTRSF